MESLVSQELHYTNHGRVSLEEIIDSLLGMKALIEFSPTVLEQLLPGLHIESASVYVDRVASGSLYEDLIVKFIWGSQERLDVQIAAARQYLKIDALLEDKRFIGAVVVATILSAAIWILRQSSIDDRLSVLEKNQSLVLNMLGKILERDPHKLKEIVDTSVAKGGISKDAMRVVEPARRDMSASIEFNNVPEIRIPSASINAMPRFPKEEALDLIEDYSSVEIQLRAYDLDSSKRGWAAVVPSLDSGRVKMHLDPHIKVADLMGKTTVVGDITVVYRMDAKGNPRPGLIFLRQICGKK